MVKQWEDRELPPCPCCGARIVVEEGHPLLKRDPQQFNLELFRESHPELEDVSDEEDRSTAPGG